MPQTIVCSICSAAKREDADPLPARERYTGTHISKVEGEALRRKMRFFILSGVLGLIPSDECIRYYNYLLTADKSAALAEKITGQIAAHNIGKIYFFTKVKPNWQPYLTALRHAAAASKVELHITELSDTD